jgi:cytochrome c peroxidase
VRTKIVLVVLALLGGAAAFAWTRRGAAPAGGVLPGPAGEFTADEVERILQHSPLAAPPRDPTNAAADDPSAAELGQAIFFDKRLSGSGKVSCATCHNPLLGFGDGKPLPEGFPVDRHVPTLWNVAYNRWYFWDGRSDTLWGQALKPLENPREHGSSRLQVAHVVRGDARLKSMYERGFGPLPDLGDARRFPAAGGPFGEHAAAWNAMTEDDRGVVDRIFSNVGKSLAAYERKLVSRASRFDTFVEGLRTGDAKKMEALSPSARLGLKIFVGKGNCRLCHGGPAFTDGEFHNLGIPPTRGGPTPSRFSAIPELRRDPFNAKGLYSDDREAGATKVDFLVDLPETWGQVKTPGLRNVAKTAPYMHQGQFKTLEEVVTFYSLLQGMLQAGHHERTILVPLLLDRNEILGLVEFLESLTDERIDERLLKPIE